MTVTPVAALDTGSPVDPQVPGGDATPACGWRAEPVTRAERRRLRRARRQVLVLATAILAALLVLAVLALEGSRPVQPTPIRPTGATPGPATPGGGGPTPTGVAVPAR